MTLLFCSVLLFCLLLVLLSLLCHLVYRQVLAPGAIYYPTPHSTVKKMLDLAKISPTDTVLDLGSGDGRLLIAAARRGATAIGYEIDPNLVRLSRQTIKKAKLQHLASVKQQSFWRADVSSATVITLYLFPQFMNRLQKILEKKLDHPLTLVSHDYQFPHKQYIKKTKNLYLYRFGQARQDSNLK